MPVPKGKRDLGRRRLAKPGAGPGGGWGFLFWVLAIGGTVFMVSMIINQTEGGFPHPNAPMRLDEIDLALEESRVESVEIQENAIVVTMKGGEAQKGKRYRKEVAGAVAQYLPKCQKLKADGKITRYDTPQGTSPLLAAFLNLIVPVGLLVLAYMIFVRPMRSAGGPGGVLNFGKSRATLLSKDRSQTTFDDVAGIDEAKEEVREIIEFLKTPAKFQRLGGRIPRGVLLVGPPGTGKTLLAKAIAGEAGVPFFSISGSDFVEMFVGVGASRVRDLFRQAKEKAPCIVFLDEIDAVGRRRGSGGGGGDHEREQTLNAILVEIDGFSSDNEVIVVAATNRSELLDPALKRPGRFDREIVIDLPDLLGRKQILEVHARKVKLAPALDLSTLARSTAGFSGADLEATINEAALLAALKGKEVIEHDDLEEARDKVLWGRKKVSRMQMMTEEDKKVTAYHESGHALVSKMEVSSEPIHKVSIIPMGHALGATMFLPEKDRYGMTRKQILSAITVAFGGRVSEELFCDDISTGAQNDLQRATELARRMVTEWGMSEHLGHAYLSDPEHGASYLGWEMPKSKPYSEETAIAVDKEIRGILDSCYQKAKEHIQAHVPEIEKMVSALMKYEVLDGPDVERIIRGEVLDVQKKERELLGRAPRPPLVSSTAGAASEAKA